jgi:hypothetical protein
MATQPVTFTAEEYDKLRQSLKEINLRAQRLQTSTTSERLLVELHLKLAPYMELAGPLKKKSRIWRDCRRFEILDVREQILADGVTSVGDPAAQSESRAIMTLVLQLDNEIATENWGIVDKLCLQLDEAIDLATRACRHITKEELRLISAIADKL